MHATTPRPPVPGLMRASSRTQFSEAIVRIRGPSIGKATAQASSSSTVRPVPRTAFFDQNNQNKAVTLINLSGSSVMRNCTIVDSGLSVTNDYCKEWSALRIASGATVQNVVVAGVTNTVDGAAVLPTGSVAKFANGAVDGDISELAAFPEGTITGTASSFFKDYANGNYTPAGPLVGKGANYEGMAETLAEQIIAAREKALSL